MSTQTNETLYLIASNNRISKEHLTVVHPRTDAVDYPEKFDILHHADELIGLGKLTPGDVIYELKPVVKIQAVTKPIRIKKL